MTLSPSAILTLLALDAAAGDSTSRPDCPSPQEGEGFLFKYLEGETTYRQPPPGELARAFLDHKDRWLRACPRNQFVWYAVLRASELTTPNSKASPSLIETAREAVPDSPWIETVRARFLGTVDTAEAIARRWPSHLPAKVVLAAAYERARNYEAALAVLRPMYDDDWLGLIAGGPVLLARVALALGDPDLAVRAARMEPTGGFSKEPVSGMFKTEEAFAIEKMARLTLVESHRPHREHGQRSGKPYELQCPPPNDLHFPRRYLGENSLMEPQQPGVRARTFLGGHQTWWLHDCPHNEMVWYTILRASELLSPEGKASAELIRAARAAVPGSAWIETVRARALGTIASAMEASRLDQAHVPAKLALAAAYERSGDPKAALHVLQSVPSLREHVGAPLLLARIAFALGDIRLAAESAAEETRDPRSHFEPVSSMDKYGEGQVFAGDAWLLLHNPDKALTAYLAAGAAATQRLLRPPGDLLRAMQIRFKNAKTDRGFRERLRGYLGAQRVRAGDIALGIRMLLRSGAAAGNEFALDTLRNGGPGVRAALEKLLGNPDLPAHEKQTIASILVN